MQFEIQASHLARTLLVDAPNWLSALRSGLRQIGEDDAIRNLQCDILDEHDLRVTDTKTGRIFAIKGIVAREAVAPPLAVGGDPSQTQAFGMASTLMDFTPSPAMTAILASAAASAGVNPLSTIPDPSFFEDQGSLEAQIRAVVESTRPGASSSPAASGPASVPAVSQPPAPAGSAPLPSPPPAASIPAAVSASAVSAAIPAAAVSAPPASQVAPSIISVSPSSPTAQTLPVGADAFDAPQGTDLAYPVAPEPLPSIPLPSTSAGPSASGSAPSRPPASASPAASGGIGVGAAIAGSTAAAAVAASAVASAAAAGAAKAASFVPIPAASVAPTVAASVAPAVAASAAPAVAAASVSQASVPPKASGPVIAQIPAPLTPKAAGPIPVPPQAAASKPADLASAAGSGGSKAPSSPAPAKPAPAPLPPTQAMPPTKPPIAQQETLLQTPKKAAGSNVASLSDLSSGGKYKPGMTTEILADAFMRAMEIYDYGEDRQAAMTFVVELAMSNLHAAGGAVLLTDLNNPLQELWFEAAVGPFASQMMNFRIPMGQGLVGFSAKEGVSLLVADVQQDPRFQSDIMKDLGILPGSVLCVPIQHQKRVLGAVQLYNQQGQRPFTQGELSIVNYLAHIAGEYLIRLV